VVQNEEPDSAMCTISPAWALNLWAFNVPVWPIVPSTVLPHGSALPQAGSGPAFDDPLNVCETDCSESV
jgi:hypothetical protein